MELIDVRPKPNSRYRAIVSVAGLTFEAAIGRGGISASKREGDGATPLARMRLIEGFYRADRVARPVTALPMRALRTDMGWCDAPFHARYNRLVRLPFEASHETMMREDGLYDMVLVMDWNLESRRARAGSAIFLHLIRPDHQPTEGCIALKPADMKRLLRVVDRGTTVRVLPS